MICILGSNQAWIGITSVRQFFLVTQIKKTNVINVSELVKLFLEDVLTQFNSKTLYQLSHKIGFMAIAYSTTKICKINC